MSKENIENITKSDRSSARTFVDHRVIPGINVNGSCLINNISIPKKPISIYISHILNQWRRDLNTDFTLGSCLYGSAKITKNADLDKYKSNDYDKGFDFCSEFSFIDGSMWGIIIVSGGDRSWPVYIGSKHKAILILAAGSAQRVDDTTLTVEAKYPINFIQRRKRFVLSLPYNRSNSFLFVNVTAIYQFKAKNYEIKDCTLYLGNISKDFTINNMEKED